MAELKTRPTTANVEDFLAALPDAKRRADCERLVEIMRDTTGEAPRMWGGSIVGFGSYHYRYESGREGDWFLTGFAPRKNDLSIHIMAGLDRFGHLLARLGPHKTGKSCLYVKRLEDVDLGVLKELVTESVREMRRTYGGPST